MKVGFIGWRGMEDLKIILVRPISEIVCLVLLPVVASVCIMKPSVI